MQNDQISNEASEFEKLLTPEGELKENLDKITKRLYRSGN